MIARLRRLRQLLIVATAVGIVLATFTASPASAKQARYFEETAQAFWEVPYVCSDGSTVPATLLVESTRDFFSPAKEDLDPTVRVQYLAVCADSTSYSWIGFLPATITSAPKLASVHAAGSGAVRDILGVSHQVSFDVTWTGTGAVVSTVNGPGSSSRQRQATATGEVTFDGGVLVDGPANHPTRPAPFIRTDTEK